MSKVPILLIAGISCSGKTTLADQLAFRLGATKVSIDDYYYGFEDLSDEAKRQINFDDPAAIDHDLLIDQLRKLGDGIPVDMPKYDHETFARSKRPDLVSPGPAIVVEGLFSLHWPDLVELTDQRIFVETDPQTAFQRRFMRDTVAFHRLPEAMMERYRSHIAPCQDQIVLPSKEKASLVVSGEKPLDETVEKIAESLGYLYR